jgi:hypothetical protein
MYAIYHRPPHELSRLCVLKKSKLASLRYASEGALDCPGVFTVVDWSSGIEIFSCHGKG